MNSAISATSPIAIGQAGSMTSSGAAASVRPVPARK